MDRGSGVTARLTRLSLDRKGRPVVQLLAPPMPCAAACSSTSPWPGG